MAANFPKEPTPAQARDALAFVTTLSRLYARRWPPTPPAHRPVDRDQHPAGRVGTVDDIASALLWLAGEETGFVTGQTIVIDGGMTRKMIYAH